MRQFLQILAVICTLIVATWSKSKESKCHYPSSSSEEDDDKGEVTGKYLLNHLSSKSPYVFEEEKKEKHKEYLPFQDCKATKFWYFGRHGTRNPGKKDTINMRKLLGPIKEQIVSAFDKCEGMLSKKQVKNLKEWKMAKNATLENESHLVKQGIKELKGIGKRYRKRFPKLFSDLSKIHIRSTSSQRTEASAAAFVQGILGSNNASVPPTLFDKPMKSDPILKFYEICTKWTEEVDENPSAIVELSDFETSPTMNNTITRVSTRLGVNNSGKILTLQEVTTIYTTCAFETAWKDGKASPWCAAFTKDDLKVMAYREDLEYYWKDGYGHRINYEQACTPIQDMLEYLDTNNSSSNTTVVRAYFSHSGATLKILARLGLFEDSSPLKSESFSEVKDSYQWRTSLIDKMGTNLAFALYDCKDRAEPEIGFLFQERPTKIPACNHNWHCPFQQFRKSLSNQIGTCDFNQTCSL